MKDWRQSQLRWHMMLLISTKCHQAIYLRTLIKIKITERLVHQDNKIFVHMPFGSPIIWFIFRIRNKFVFDATTIFAYLQLTSNTIDWIQTPFQHQPKQCFPKSLSKFRFLPLTVFSLATFRLCPWTFTCFIQLPGANSNSSIVSISITRSPAYKCSHGQPC